MRPFTLRAKSISHTIDRLEARVRERFPESGLKNVCKELAEVGRKAHDNIAAVSRPYWLVRAFSAVLVVIGLVTGAGVIGWLRPTGIDEPDPLTLVQGTDALLNISVLVGAGVFFLVTLEERVKRRRVLADLYELRSLIHVVDMHQLTKDPVTLLNPHLRTKSSPRREGMTAFMLNRYLDYCTEMLSLTGKLAALYAQDMRDPVVIRAVNETESLAAALSAKIWQKIMLLERAYDTSPDAASVASSADGSGGVATGDGAATSN